MSDFFHSHWHFLYGKELSLFVKGKTVESFETDNIQRREFPAYIKFNDTDRAEPKYFAHTVFTDGSELLCVASEDGDYSEYTPGEGTVVSYYGRNFFWDKTFGEPSDN